MKAMAGSTLLWLGVAALMVVAAVFAWQDKLLYFPDRTTVARIATGPLRAWPSAQEFRGLVAEPAGPVRGTALVFNGNAGHAGHRDFHADALVPLGLRVILAEYPGYGPRGGAVGEESLVADAEASLRLAHQRHRGPVVLVGESLGAAVASAAAANRPDLVAGLLLITPWDRLGNVAAHHYPWLPVRWLLRDEHDTQGRLAAFGRPVLVVVAERDSIVPARFGGALHAALGGPKRLQVIAGSDHNDWPERVDARWWRDAIGFVLDRPAG